MPINQLIANSPLRTRTPVQSYLQSRDQMQQQQVNQLAMQESRQNMKVKQMAMAKANEERKLEKVALYMRDVKDLQGYATARQELKVNEDIDSPETYAPDRIKSVVEHFYPEKDLDVPTKRTMPAGTNPRGQNLVVDRLYQGNKVIEESKPYVKKEVERTAAVDISPYEGKGARDKQLIDFEDATTASLNVIDTSTEVINAIRTSPSSARFSGDILAGINESVKTVSNLVSVMRPDSIGDTVRISDGEKTRMVNKSSIGDLYGEELSNFRNSAIWSQELDAMLVNLGYQAAMAKGQTGKGLSDMDLKMNMKEVGKVTDNIGVERLIRKFTKRTINAYKNKAQVKGRLDSKYTEMIDSRMTQFDTLWSDDTPPSQSQGQQEFDPDAWLQEAERQ